MAKLDYCYQCKYYRPGILIPPRAYCSSSKSDFFQNKIAEHFICKAFIGADEKAPLWMLLLNRFLHWLNKQKENRKERKRFDEVYKRATGGGPVFGDGFICLIYILTFIFLLVYIVLEFFVMLK